MDGHCAKPIAIKKPVYISGATRDIDSIYEIDSITTKITDQLIASNTQYYNFLSYQIPPPSNSPPSSDFINTYLNYKLTNHKLNLNYSSYNEYK